MTDGLEALVVSLKPITWVPTAKLTWTIMMQNQLGRS